MIPRNNKLVRNVIIVNHVILVILIFQNLFSTTPKPPPATENEELQFDTRLPEELGSSRSKSFPCEDITSRSYHARRGNYWALYNYLGAAKSFRCDESITYTTYGDWTYLDNVIPLLERWQGPLSLTLYAPGTDFDGSLKGIQYLRECSTSPLVKELVTFHIFFDRDHVPKRKLPLNPELLPVNCSDLRRTFGGGGLQTYRKSMNLTYPINVGRNVAKEMATTHYVLPSDIELYPSPNLIPEFLEMIRLNDASLQRPPPKVFPLSIFELEPTVTLLPRDKRELLKMLDGGLAILFHKYVCSICHQIPKDDEWRRAPIRQGLAVFHIGKRHYPYQRWEPIFIGTKSDPEYDERLSWEGMRDKMVQGYHLCALDYEFHILDNAFLVHRPGIKRIVDEDSDSPTKKASAKIMSRQNSLISKTIMPELLKLYGPKPNCTIS